MSIGTSALTGINTSALAACALEANAMVMVLSAILALVSCVVAFLKGKPKLFYVAGAAALVSVLAFIIRSLVGTFFADV